MKKIYSKIGTLVIAIVATLCICPQQSFAQVNAKRPVGSATHSLQSAPQKLKLNSTGEDEKLAYGILAFSNSGTYTNGLISFPLLDGGDFNKIRLFGDATHDVTAAAYADGYYYMAKTVLDGEVMVPCELLRYDIDSDTQTSVGELSGFSKHINDMTYDYSTKTMYAIYSPNNYASELYTIDLTTAESKLVASCDSMFFTLACTYDGQLYGISMMGSLCKINKTSGEVTPVGHTGMHPTYYQSMEFDHSDEILYWAAVLQEADYYTVGATDLIAEIDLETGEASMLSQVSDGPEIAGLYIPFSASAPGTPAAVGSYSVVPDAAGANQAVLSWTNPTATYDGKTLTAISEVRVYRDKELVKTFTEASPGEQMTYTDITEPSSEGLGATHTYVVVAVNDAGEGAESKAQVFVGHDLPLPVTNLTMTAEAYDKAALTWTAPAGGVNGGYLDRATLTYTVTRYPGAVVVAENLTETSYTDASITDIGTYYYTVKAVNNDGESEIVTSESLVFGPALTMPVTFDFSDTDEANSWTFVDANADGYGWLWTTNSSGEKVMGHQASNTAKSDDWLLSYYIPFVEGTRYRIDLDLHAYSKDCVEFYIVDKFNYESPVANVYTLDITGAQDVKHYSLSFNAPATGDYNLALRAVSPMRADWLEIYNLSIREAEKYNLAATSLTGEQKPRVNKEYTYTLNVENQGSTKTYAFKAYLKDQDGTELIQKSVAKTLQPGDATSVELTWTPKSTETTGLVGEVQLFDATDEYADDNVTDTLSVSVQDAFDGDVVALGTSSIYSSSDTPFNFPYQYSASLNIYSADEIGEGFKYINKIGWPYDASYVYSDVTDANIKVYMANTELSNTTAGWIAEDELTLVYDGPINISAKTSDELTVQFSSFDYEEGKNLAVLTVLSCDTYVPYLTFTQYTSPLSGNMSHDWHSYSYTKNEFDFTQSGTQNYYKRNASVLLYMSNTVAIDDIRKDAAEDIIGNANYAVYDINGRRILTGTSDDNGNVDTKRLSRGIYIIDYNKAGRHQSVKISVNK